METIIYLIRHSKQLKYTEQYFSKDSDQVKNEKIIISVEGERKAEALSKNSELKNIDLLYSSNYVRAVSTAKYIAFENNININVDERLGERKLGDLVALEELGKKYTNDYTTEQLLNPNLKNLDGESNEEVRKRMHECINEIINNNLGKRIAIVSHGAAIKYFLQEWCDYDYEKDALFFEGNYVCPKHMETPSAIKLVFIDNLLKSASSID